MAVEHYDDNRNFEDLSNIVTHLPLQDLGLFDVARRNAVQAINVKHEWQELPSEVKSTTVDTGDWDNSATTNLVVTDASIFKKYDMIQVGSEVCIVSAVDVANDDIDVYARGHGSTSPAAHSAGDPVYIIGSAAAQGNDKDGGFQVQPSTKFNYCQIFKEEIEVSDTQNAVKTPGGMTLSQRKANAIRRIFARVNRAMWFGILNADTTNKIYTMQGLFERMSTNAVNASSASFTVALFNQLLRTCYNEGKPADIAWFPGNQYEDLCTLLGAQIDYKNDDLVFGGRVAIFRSPYGDVEIKKDIDLTMIAPTKVIAGQKEWVKMAELRSLRSWLNGQNGSKQDEQIEMEVTLQVRHENCFGELYGLAL